MARRINPMWPSIVHVPALWQKYCSAQLRRDGRNPDIDAR